jgi:hypothetical protein
MSWGQKAVLIASGYPKTKNPLHSPLFATICRSMAAQISVEQSKRLFFNQQNVSPSTLAARKRSAKGAESVFIGPLHSSTLQTRRIFQSIFVVWIFHPRRHTRRTP